MLWREVALRWEDGSARRIERKLTMGEGSTVLDVSDAARFMLGLWRDERRIG